MKSKISLHSNYGTKLKRLKKIKSVINIIFLKSLMTQIHRFMIEFFQILFYIIINAEQKQITPSFFK